MASCTTTMIYKETYRFNVFLSSTWKLLEKCDFEDHSYALIIQKATEATKIKDVTVFCIILTIQTLEVERHSCCPNKVEITKYFTTVACLWAY